MLDELEAGGVESTVEVDALADGMAAFPATVERVDPLHDLAVLRAATGLPRSVPGLVATDDVAAATPVKVTGVSEVADVHSYRYLTATGSWQEGTVRDNEVPLGRLKSPDVMPGMSGAPVRRLADDLVVGVVSGRYNSADGWLAHSVWVARTENLRPLLAGLVPIELVSRLRLDRGADLVLEVDQQRVTLRGAGREASAAHRGVGEGLRWAVREAREFRARSAAYRALSVAEAGPVGLDEPAVRRAGRHRQ